MRVDAHQHFWKYDPERYAWIGEEMAGLQRDHLPGDLAPLLERHGIDATVAVQARQDPEETRWLLDLADAHRFVAGVVGWVDLRSSEVDAQLDELGAHPRLVGVRHVVQDEPDDRFLLRDDFVAGVAELAALGLVYDVLIYPRQLPAALEFTARLPEQPMVLDHLAKPHVARGELEPWASQVRELARRENVTCKLSGLVTEARWDTWSPRDLAPYLDVALEAFGPERLMLGSDWPVCRLAAEYGEVLAVVEELVRGLSADEAAAILGGTASRVYGLAP